MEEGDPYQEKKAKVRMMIPRIELFLSLPPTLTKTLRPLSFDAVYCDVSCNIYTV